MRWGIAGFMLAACSSPHHAAVTPDAPPVDSADQWLARETTGVALGASAIAWSEQAAACGLEQGLGCHGPGPMVTVANAGQITQLAISAYGATAIAGDETGWFYADDFTGALMRVTATTTPTTFATGMARMPAVDATHVYWLDAGGEGVPFEIRSASRTGDGTDATAIAHPAAFQDTLYAFAGDVWWWACTTQCEVHRATSTTPVRTGVTIVGADANALYLLEYGTTWSLLAMAPNGSTTTLLANQPQQLAPQHLVVDSGELFWSTTAGIYRAQPNGTPALAVAATNQVFAIMPTQILYDFTPRGYASVAR